MYVDGVYVYGLHHAPAQERPHIRNATNRKTKMDTAEILLCIKTSFILVVLRIYGCK